MFGKVLLLALVCVAANSQVVEENLNSTINAALNETRRIRDRTFSNVNSALDIYYDNDQIIRDTVREQFKIFEDFGEKQIEIVTATSQKLVKLATQAQASKEVFECISTRTAKTVQDLKNVVSNFDKTITQNGETKRQELFRVAYGLFQIRANFLFHDNLFATSKAIKGCTTPECVQEILDRYRQENDKISAEITQTMSKLRQNLEKAKRDIKNTLIAARTNINKVKGVGVNGMRVCLIIKN